MIQVFITRPDKQGEVLCQMFEKQGIKVFNMPLQTITPLGDTPVRIEQLLMLPAADWLIFSSVNAVKFFFENISERLLSYCRQARIAAIGKKTAKALEELGLTIDAVPQAGFDSESLLALPVMQNLTSQRILCIRGQDGRELIADTLQERGGLVSFFDVYRREPIEPEPRAFHALFSLPSRNILTITSGEALKLLLKKAESPENRALLLQVTLVLISQRLKDMAAVCGFNRVILADGPSDNAILNAVLKKVSGV